MRSSHCRPKWPSPPLYALHSVQAALISSMMSRGLKSETSAWLKFSGGRKTLGSHGGSPSCSFAMVVSLSISKPPTLETRASDFTALMPAHVVRRPGGLVASPSCF